MRQRRWLDDSIPSARLFQIQISNPSKSQITFLFRFTSKMADRTCILKLDYQPGIGLVQIECVLRMHDTWYRKWTGAQLGLAKMRCSSFFGHSQQLTVVGCIEFGHFRQQKRERKNPIFWHFMKTTQKQRERGLSPFSLSGYDPDGSHVIPKLDLSENCILCAPILATGYWL